MIRVVYRWRVDREDIPAFHAAWSAATTAIHESVEGARGSLLLHDLENPGRIVTMARWNSLAHWRAFWRSAARGRMQAMSAIAVRTSITVYDEFADLTV